jgi:hypothetical protein
LTIKRRRKEPACGPEKSYRKPSRTLEKIY